jgi:hypothetical protein
MEYDLIGFEPLAGPRGKWRITYLDGTVQKEIVLDFKTAERCLGAPWDLRIEWHRCWGR